MLGKLFKHEFKSTGRLFLPLYAVVIVMTPLLALMIHIFDFKDDSPLTIISGFSMVGYVLLLVGVGVASFVLVILRFYRSMTKENAYLTFMLPVKTSSLVFSKLLVAFVWQALTVIIISLSIAGFTFANGLWKLSDFSHVYDSLASLLEMTGELRSHIILMLILYLITMIVGTISGTLQIYASISIGQTAKKRRVLTSFGCYIGFYMASQLISSIILLPFALFSSTSLLNGSEQTANQVLSEQIAIIAISLGLSIVLGIVYFIITTKVFKKHLNLE